MTIAQAIFVVAGLAFQAAQQRSQVRPKNWIDNPWPRAILMMSVVLGTGFCVGAIQLIPAHLYAAHTIRFYGDAAFPSNQKPPYMYTTQSSLTPAGMLSVLFVLRQQRSRRGLDALHRCPSTHDGGACDR